MDAAISSTDIGATVPSVTPRDFTRTTSRQVDLLDTNAVLAGDIAPGPINSLTILIPVMNEEGNLPELYARLLSSLDAIGLPFEIIFVDDGSSDETWNIDFCHERTRSSGDRTQASPQLRQGPGALEWIRRGRGVTSSSPWTAISRTIRTSCQNFLTMLDEGYDLVSGWKQRRQDPLGKTAPSRVFNWTVRKTTGVQLHDFNCGFKAYRREVTSSIRLYGELHRFTPVLASAEGFRIGELPVKHHARKWGSSKYGWSRLTKGFLDLLTVIFLTQYRQRPMHLFGLPGLISMALGVLLGFVAHLRETRPRSLDRNPAAALLLSVLLVVIGAQFFGLGLLGEFQTHRSNAPSTTARLPLSATVGISTRPQLGGSDKAGSVA